MSGASISLDLSPEALRELAQDLVPLVTPLLSSPQPERDGYLNPEAAAEYLGVKRKRVYDLKSMGALVPDGFDGRTPLFTRETIDNYVRTGSS